VPIDAARQQEQMRMAEELLFSGKPLPSFAKALYFGLCDAKRIFPFSRVDEAERQRVEKVVSELKEFCDANLDPVAIDETCRIPDNVIEGLGRIGALGCTIPAEYGGLGLSQYGYCRIEEEVASRCGSTALFINAHQSIGLKALLLYGSEAQKQRFLPPLARGEMLAAFALTEPNAGSDAAGVETRAVYDPEKKLYRLNGQKQWITNGSEAGMLTVMAQTEIDGKDKITAFIVTPDMPGFKVTHASLRKVGMRGSITSKLAFEDVEVPEENILGTKGEGLKLALTVLNYGRTTFGATCTGAAKAMYGRAVAHAVERHQFDRPLASFGLVKEKIARMAAHVYAMDASTYLTAGLLDRGEEDFMLETAMLKVFTSDSLWDILYDTMQILGGRSFFCDEPYERVMRDARLNMIGEGSNEVMRAFIGVVGVRDVGMQLEGIVDAAKSPLAGIGTLVGFGKKSIGQIVKAPTVPVQSDLLTEEAKALGAQIRQLGLAVPRLLAKHREAIVEKQLTLNRLAEAGMAFYTTAAVLSKLDTDLATANGNPAALGNDVAAAKLYCKLAHERAQRALDGLFKNHDDEIERVADRITGWK
jgi:acyl-CoA dehydrogenase family member 9